MEGYQQPGVRPFRLLKVAYYFLQREQARRAWFIFAVCVAFASLPFTAKWLEVRQGVIVLAGLAAGAIFLPELNSRLWYLNAKEIRDTIPEHRRRAFYIELIRADCPDNDWAQRWAMLMWRRGVIPLLDAARDSRRIRWDMNYEVSVHLNQEYEIATQKKMMTRVETNIDNERVLPAAVDGLLWVSVCGNEASLLWEFNDERCLSRELVDLPSLDSATWATEIRRWCHVRVQVGPRVITFDPDSVIVVSIENLRIVRWLVPVSQEESDGTPVSCQIEMHFPMEVDFKNFPILFAGYYCPGRTVASFKLYHGQAPRPVLHWRHSEVAQRLPSADEKLSSLNNYFGDDGAGVATWHPERFDTEDRQSVIYRTPPDGLLWPGFGIYFWWEFTTDLVPN
jgi:hypothetical protein